MKPNIKKSIKENYISINDVLKSKFEKRLDF